MPSHTQIMPKEPVSAQIVLFGGQTVSGEFFVASSSPVHEGPETLLDLINDDKRSFVPFQTEDGMMLLNRLAVRMVEVDSPELRDIFLSPNNEYIYAMTIALRTEVKEITFQGCCYTGDLRPEVRRPVDLLNSTDLFILLFSQGKALLLNKSAVSHATLE